MGETDPLVSVILTTYNRPQFIKQAIDSVLEQTYTNFELLVMDDDSDDQEQKDILMSYWNIPKVKIFKSSVVDGERKNVVRYAYMANIGLLLSSGDYITYLCDDDFYFPERLEKMVEYLENHEEAEVVYGKQVKLKRTPSGRTKRIGERFQDMILDRAAYWVDHSSVMHSRKIYEELGGWDTNPEYWTCADAVYWKIINDAGYKFYPLEFDTDAHIFHDKSMTVKNNWSKLT